MKSSDERGTMNAELKKTRLRLVHHSQFSVQRWIYPLLNPKNPSRHKKENQMSQVITKPKVNGTKPELVALAEPAANPNMAAVLMRAVEMSAPIETLERIAKMIEEAEARLARAEFNAAMARAESSIVPIVNGEWNEHLNSGYAGLADINSVAVPIYSAEGLNVSFDTETTNENDPVPDGKLRTVAIVGHSRGHERRYHIDLAPDLSGSAGKVNKTAVQAAGSTNEYGRRYLMRMIFNLSTRDDRDGNSPEGPSECINAEQTAMLQKLMGEVNQNMARFFSHYKIKTLAELPATSYADVIEYLEVKIAKLKKAPVCDGAMPNLACDHWVYDPKSKFCLKCGYPKVDHTKAVA